MLHSIYISTSYGTTKDNLRKFDFLDRFSWVLSLNSQQLTAHALLYVCITVCVSTVTEVRLVLRLCKPSKGKEPLKLGLLIMADYLCGHWAGPTLLGYLIAVPTTG